MNRFEVGKFVGIPCDLGSGAFVDEYLVTIETAEGPVSGFITKENLELIDGEKGVLRGEVVELGADTITVKVRGSFFTTTGLAYLPRDWAASNLRSL